MRTNVELIQARETLKRDLIVNQDNIPVTRIFFLINRILRKITRRERPYPWYIGAIILALIVPLPTVILSLVLEEIEQWKVLGFI